MKIPKEEKAQLVDGLLEMLDPEAVEQYESIDKVMGRVLINIHGLTKTAKGDQVLPGKIYMLTTTATRKINHRQRIGQIIADSKTTEEMNNRLGEHLAKYAKDPAEVVRSIPFHLSIQNKIRDNEN